MSSVSSATMSSCPLALQTDLMVTVLAGIGVANRPTMHERNITSGAVSYCASATLWALSVRSCAPRWHHP